ncbi:MAG: hypothetical protein QOF76_2246 [Solirubrobacteraceae bacterium]|jgi:hypothetical protein|nr:hypothetical protein [Solirubrobacteraceae bacterium]
MTAPTAPPAGLCNLCVHQQVVKTGRGSVFSLCLRHKTDDRYPKYPRVPVTSCPGFTKTGAG